MSNDDFTMKIKKYKVMNKLHADLSHPSEATMQATGKAMNLIVTGEFQP